MESASADDVRARGSPKGLVLAPLQAQAQHYPKGEGWKRSQFGSRKRSQTDRQTDAPTTTTLIASGPPLRGDPYFVCISTTLLRNKTSLSLSSLRSRVHSIVFRRRLSPPNKKETKIKAQCQAATNKGNGKIRKSQRTTCFDPLRGLSTVNSWRARIRV